MKIVRRKIEDGSEVEIQIVAYPDGWIRGTSYSKFPEGRIELWQRVEDALVNSICYHVAHERGTFYQHERHETSNQGTVCPNDDNQAL